MLAMSKKTVHHMIDTLTADAIMAKLGVSFHMIRYARTTGMFPASWYGPLKVMADDVGIPCPLSAFNWKSTANTISTDAQENQDATEKGAA